MGGKRWTKRRKGGSCFIVYYERIQDFKYYRAGVGLYQFRAFGNAYLATHLKSNQNFVIKKI
jgi:hypothetical protein